MPHSEAVVGIDVSSGKLDAHVAGTDQSLQMTNDAAGHRELAAWSRAKRATTAVMEASGGYERDLARAPRRICRLRGGPEAGTALRQSRGTAGQDRSHRRMHHCRVWREHAGGWSAGAAA